MQRFFYLFLCFSFCFLEASFDLPSIEHTSQENEEIGLYLNKIEGSIETQEKQIAQDAKLGDKVALCFAGVEYLSFFLNKGRELPFLNKAYRCFEASGRLGFAPALKILLDLHLMFDNKQSLLFGSLYLHLLLHYRHQEFLTPYLQLSAYFQENGGQWINERIKETAKERYYDSFDLKSRLCDASQAEVNKLLFAESADEHLFEEFHEYAEQMDLHNDPRPLSLSTNDFPLPSLSPKQ